MLSAALAAVRDWVTDLGGVGLFVLALLDSSFLSFPQVNDVLIVYLSTKQPSLMVWYAGMSTIGSVLGCTALFLVGRRGGEAFLLRRFKARHIERGLRLYARFGLFTVLVPALLPPPTPFKLFVLLAGTSGLSTTRFVIAVTLGRGVRYFGTGYLALLYGERALEILQEHGTQIGIALAAFAVAAGLAAYAWRRAARRSRQ
jgi:membrane protein YqaA with SNARE-associated domain